MPPSSDWAFSPREKVLVVDPANPVVSMSSTQEVYFNFGVPLGTEAVITSVKDDQCELTIQRLDGVRIIQEDRLVPQSFLRKKIDVGDVVSIVAPGALLRRFIRTGLQSVTDPDLPPVSARSEVGLVVELQQNATVARVVIGKFEAVSLVSNVYI